jgi:glyoxylase-like metal-dependent hydrolase (beta-lactamase superfamily II)
MKTNRRKFIQTVGAGAAGLGFAATVPSAAAQAKKAIKAGDTFPNRVGAGRQKQMWPIKSEMKSRRLKFDAPQDPISWAYMKELREHDKTKKVYPVNPYVEVYQFRDNLYALLTENNDGGGDVWMFLIVGPEKAMLIDTAFGLGDVKGLVDAISGGKPLIVANTHEHYDHAYGNCRFDKVYCHEFLVPYLQMQHEHMWDYLFDDYNDNIWLEYDRKDLPKFKKYEIVGVKDGHMFNLGGDYEVELVFTGGHSAGHAAFIDKKDRIVFIGDDIISDTAGCGSINVTRPGPHAENTSLKVWRDNLKRLIDRMDEFDYVYPGHFMLDIENAVMLDTLQALDEVLANPESYTYKVEKWAKGATEPTVRYFKRVRGFSQIAYNYRKA